MTASDYPEKKVMLRKLLRRPSSLVLIAIAGSLSAVVWFPQLVGKTDSDDRIYEDRTEARLAILASFLAVMAKHESAPPEDFAQFYEYLEASKVRSREECSRDASGNAVTLSILEHSQEGTVHEFRAIGRDGVLGTPDDVIVRQSLRWNK